MGEERRGMDLRGRGIEEMIGEGKDRWEGSRSRDL
jgi:hypothetical protein